MSDKYEVRVKYYAQLSCIQPGHPDSTLSLDEEPANNDSRANCYWCGGLTKKIEGFNSFMHICTKCKR